MSTFYSIIHLFYWSIDGIFPESISHDSGKVWSNEPIRGDAWAVSLI